MLGNRARAASWLVVLAVILLIWWYRYPGAGPPLEESEPPIVPATSPLDQAQGSGAGPALFPDLPAEMESPHDEPALLPGLAERADWKRRSSPVAAPLGIADRQKEEILDQIEEARSVESMQAALVRLLQLQPDRMRVRSALDILGRQPEAVQRQVFSILRSYIRPEWEDMLTGFLADPSPHVARGARIALEEMLSRE